MNKLTTVVKTTFMNLTQLTTLLLANNICINTNFNSTLPLNPTIIINALAACDDCPCGAYVNQMKSMALSMKTMHAMLVNMSSTFDAILSIP